uniref:Small ribosomal subunit protein uS3m n=1 Tax=Stropharia rugosoannulata TaxID=68746 RepID=A0A3G9HJN4_9AGAR|nr:ribosomal protein S3 [Stropharia rugosoannulata]
MHLDKSKKPSILSRFSKSNSIAEKEAITTPPLSGESNLPRPLNNNSRNFTGSKGGLNLLEENSTSLHGYIRNNDEIERINVSPKIGIKNGLLLNYQKFISYNFNKSSGHCFTKSKNVLTKWDSSRGGVKDTYDLLYYFFKSIYCLISKPVFLESSNKIIIQLFYYLSIPKKKVFKFFSIMYLNSFKNKWLKKKSQAFSIRKYNHNLKSKVSYGYAGGYSNNFNRAGKLFIKWRVRKAISRLRSKNTSIRTLLFNLRKYNLSKVFYRKFYLICKILSKKFNKSVELQLIRLHNPNHDSNILINLISLNIRNKRKNARNAINKIYAKNQIKIINDPSLNPINFIPSYLSGINIKIAGRLMREPIIPRITTKTFERGASSTGKVNYLDVATITKKNRKGAYTITIKSGQNFFSSPATPGK